MAKSWTKEDEEFLKEWFPTESAALCAEVLERTPGSINTKAQKLGLKKQKKTDEQLIEELQKFAEDIGHSPSSGEVARNKELSHPDTYANRFGSWRNAKVKAGLDTVNKQVRGMSRDEILFEFKNLANELNKVPTYKDVKNCDKLPSSSTILEKFDSWQELCIEANLVLSDDELLEDLRSLSKKLGKRPTHIDLQKEGMSSSTYISRFGSWPKALEKIGYTIKEQKTRTRVEMLVDLKYLSNLHNRIITSKDLTPKMASASSYHNIFGSWNNALEEADLKTKENFTKKELVETLQHFYKEYERSPTTQDCSKVPYLKSASTYFLKFGSFENALVVAGLPLNTLRSAMERDLEIFIKNNYNGKVVSSDKKLLGGSELDIYLPDIGLAIEFNGLYWHSEERVGKKHHIYKTKQCNRKGVQLIHIMEHEWVLKEGIVKSRILGLLGKSKRIYARKCEMREIGSASEFFANNHIQGNVNASKCLGLFFEGELVAAMSFSKSRFNQSYEYELLRYCNKLNHTVVGGASKLLKYFRSKYKGSLISYCDLRWSEGNLYKVLGFTHLRNSPPNYWYFKKLNVESRVKYQKHKLKNKLEKFDSELTEVENMYNNGWMRYFDCGNGVYVLE